VTAPAPGDPDLRVARTSYRARFDECGPDALARASALLRWAQDVAWIHSERRGFGREWYAERDLAWVVRGMELRMLAPIRTGTTVEVETQVVGFRRVMARRRTEVRAPDGSLAALIVNDWVMTDVRRAAPARVPPEFPALFGVTHEGFEPIRDYIGFYPKRMDACWVGADRVTPQPGFYYGGWVTPNLVGPFKGSPGSESW